MLDDCSNLLPSKGLMIKTAKINNFRGLSHVDLRDLKRINVLIGPNGTGKTALLEALFLALGGAAEIGIRIRQWRGREGLVSTTSAAKFFDALWADLFGTTNELATIEVRGDRKVNRRVEISKAGFNTIMSPDNLVAPSNMGVQFALYDLSKKGKPPEIIIPSFLQDNKVDTGKANQVQMSNFVPSRSAVSEGETAGHYSELSIRGEKAKFDDVFLAEFPLIEEISVQAPFGPRALYGRMRNGRLLPLSMISGGVNHLAGILARMANCPNSIMVIDEIENGIFYERFEATWRAISQLANENNVQVFASTHSAECLRALSTAMKENSGDVSFIRHRIDGKAKISVQQLTGKQIFNAMPLGDVR